VERRSKARFDDRELLGLTYSRAALTQIRAMLVAPPGSATAVPTLWLSTTGEARYRNWGGDIETVVTLDCEWRNTNAIDDVIPDVGLTTALAELLQRNADG
jgi:hypothetical protein